MRLQSMDQFDLLTNDNTVVDRSDQLPEGEHDATDDVHKDDVHKDDASESRGSTSSGAEAAPAVAAVDSNLALVLGAWNTIVQSGSTQDLAAILHEQVVWQGALPDSVSRGRVEVLGVLADNPAPHLTRIEARERGDRVLLTMEGPDFPLTEGHRAGIRSLVFTLRNGAVVRMETVGKRDQGARPSGS
jgi:hypothetical protein